jgi:NADH dehydrogenase (ubiquinone) 1 beta subcomplex subunit 7
MPLSRDDLRRARVPLKKRDYCAHLWIPLEKCREETLRMPWKCSEEQHLYDFCVYMEYDRLSEGVNP